MKHLLAILVVLFVPYNLFSQNFTPNYVGDQYEFKPHTVYMVGATAYVYQDGSGNYVVENRIQCTPCRGTGVCSVCNGMGGIYMSYSGGFMVCAACQGARACSTCGGHGYIVSMFVSRSPLSDDAIKQCYYSARSAFSTYTGDTYSSSSGKSSSSSSSSSKGIDVKIYAPKYVANSAQVWCEKCQCYGDRHFHKEIK